MQVLSPCPGRVFPITEADDPVFAAEMVGPGVAIEPSPARTTVVAPVAGTILKLHPHAFAMVTADGLGVLVHLGINTVKLDGAGFELVASEGGLDPRRDQRRRHHHDGAGCRARPSGRVAGRAGDRS